MSENINSLVNLGTGKIAEKAYDDILSNPGKRTGEALGTIINVGNTLLWPIKWANERTRIYFENNLRKYEQKLNNIDEAKIIEVPTEISMPILERFTYVSNEEISEAFINLLTTASNIDTIQFAHPSFIQIIDRLSPDEALIIKYFSEKDGVPYLSLACYAIEENEGEKGKTPKLNRSQYYNLEENGNNICKHIQLNFDTNIKLYLDNLISLGIIKCVNRYYTSLDEELNELQKEIIDKHKEYFQKLPEKLQKNAEKIDKGMYELTEFGKLFIKAAIQ